MIAFHIDMNMAQYRADYLRRWLGELARCGYDTVLWEVENNVAWETCPECASPDAFSKQEFRALLDESRALGLEPIPLFQTIGHAEYVLKHAPYAHLKELPERIDQYCPRHPDVVPFLRRWIEEYLEVFGDLRYFHLGADEAYVLGACPRCRAYAAEHSLSQLYIDHVNAVAAPLVAHGITPMIWADMVLHHHQALEALSRKIVLCDWMYDIYRGSGRVYVWGQGMRRKEELDDNVRARFGPYLFPEGDEPAREPETFYTADFLAAQGFRVVTCPAAASYGDNVFSPRHWLHLANTFDSVCKGLAPHLGGSILTSWSVRLHPWELQLACIELAGFLAGNPGNCASSTLKEFQAGFVRERFGIGDGADFWRACGLLSKSCLFSDSGTLGFSKDCLPVAPQHVQRQLARILEQGGREHHLQICRARLVEYREALARFTACAGRADRGQQLLDAWMLAARSLINRAGASELLLTDAEGVVEGRAPEGAARGRAQALLRELRELRGETEALYRTMIRPTRKDEMLAYMFGPVENALACLAGEDTAQAV